MKKRFLTQNTTLFILLLFAPLFVSGVVNKQYLKVNAPSLTPLSYHIVTDNEFTNMTTNPSSSWGFTNIGVTNTVAIGYDVNYYQKISGYNDIDFNLRLRKKDENGTLTTEDITLTVNPNSNQTQRHRQLHLYKFSGAYKVNVLILSIKSNGANITPPPNMYMELTISSERYYDFNPGNVPTSLSHSLLDLSANPQTIASTNVNTAYAQADEMEISWNSLAGAEEYELEWTYVNNYKKDSGQYFPATLIDFDQDDFHRNSTRVKVAGTNYRIPLIYDKGFVVYRIRGIGRDAVDFSKREVGVWTHSTCTSNLGCFSPNYQHIDGHQKSKNWQRAIAFAEEGKRKETLNYFDGTQRKRQSIVKNNSDNLALVSQDFYDYQGRPVISVMPTPAGEEIKYYEGYNVHASGNEYTKSYYDGDAGSCLNNGAPQMNANYGSARYYSIANPDKAGHQGYLPDAVGHVFSQTEYTADNTGRVKRQGGIGNKLRIGSGNEVFYFYGTPDQEELDRIFGTDVGYAQHYKKNVVIDANGQASITYFDLADRPIATGLTGDRPSTLLPVTNSSGTALDQLGTSSLTIDMLNKDADGDADDDDDNNNVNAAKDGLELNYSFIYPTEDDFDATYTLSAPVFTDACLATSYAPVVDVAIDIISKQCLTNLYSLDTTIGTANTSAATATTFSYTVPTLTNIDAGDYKVEKRLIVNKDTLDYYAEQYISDASCLYTYQEFLDSAWTDIDTTDCDPFEDANGWFDCAACSTAVGPVADYDNVDEWQAAIDDCMAPCTYTSTCDAIEQAMLADVSPGGQYATYEVDANGKYFSNDPLSIFNGGWDPNHPNLLPSHPNFTAIDIDSLIDNWDDGLAQNYIQYHPENYYRVNGFCTGQTTIPSGYLLSGEQYDWMLNRVSTYSDATSAQYLSQPSGGINLVSPKIVSGYPAILHHDPYFNNGNSADKNAFSSLLLNFKGSGKNIYEYAANIAECGSWFGNNPSACTPTPVFGTGSTAVKDEQYRLLKGFYLSAKQEFLYNQLTESALNISGAFNSTPLPGYFNGAIGQQKFNFYKYILKRYNITLSNWPTAAFAYANAIWKIWSQQQISGVHYKHYRNKQKRFNHYDPHLEENGSHVGENDADYEVYIKTGMCPLAMDVKLLLEDLATTNRLKTNNLRLLYVPGFTQDLYKTITGFSNIGSQNYADYYYQYTLLNSNRTLNIDLNLPVSVGSATSKPDFIELEFQSGSSFNWSNFNSGTASSFTINRVVNLVPTGSNGSYYTFALEVNITNSSGIHTEVLSGKIKNINLSGCQGSFEPYAHTSVLASDMEDLMTLLANNGQFTSTAGQNIEVSPYASAFQSNVENVVNPSQANLSNVFKWIMINANKLEYEIRSTSTNRHISVEFCNQPSGTGFTNGFDDVNFFQNIKLKSPNDPNSCIIDNDMANFSVEAVNVNEQTGSITGTSTIYGRMEVVYIDEMDQVIEEPLDLGYYGSFTSTNDSCKRYSEVRTGLQDLLNNVMPADFSDQVYPADPGLSFSISQTLRNELGVGVPFNNCPTSQLVAYTGVEVPGDEDHYVGFFWTHHGTPTTPPSYTINYDDGVYTAVINSCGHSYGLFTCQIRMNFVDESSSLRFSNVVGISHLVESTNIGGPQFTAIAEMNNGTYEKVEGSTCFNISNCNGCTKVNPPVPENCWALFQTYEQTLSSALSDLTTLSMEDFCSKNVSTERLNKYVEFLSLMGIHSITHPYYISFEEFCRKGMDYYTSYYYAHLLTILQISSNSNIAANLPSDPNDIIGLEQFTELEIGLNCVLDYADAVSAGIININEVDIIAHCDGSYPPEYPCPSLDFRPFPAETLEGDPCTEYYTNVAQNNATQAYNQYVNQVKDDFRRRYIDHILNSTVETFKRTSTSGVSNYQYTLFYYDQSGNLIKTVPPEGVTPFTGTAIANVKGYRNSGTTSQPSHTMATKYVYNTLNQLKSQTTPDGGTTNFWYDKLGRLVLSQDATQAPYYYNYVEYDALGRVVETGELYEANTITYGNLNNVNFPNNLDQVREEVTRTYYDAVQLTAAYTYYNGLNSSFNFNNLQNRVSAVAYYPVYNENLGNKDLYYHTATHYGYDEHGNVETAVQDFRGYFALDQQRYKRTDYTFDLISGNVKEVAYQKDNFDQLLHRYEYDADNRLIAVNTSHDGIIWDEDASYNYYKHGPLARTEIGQFKVQGLDRAYTLQGWLKAMNSTTLKVERDISSDDNSPTYEIARDAFAYSLNYFNGDYTPIGQTIGGNSDAVASTSGMSTTDLFNGNISGMVKSIWDVNEDPIRTEGSSFRYDQLNRIKEADIYHKYSSNTDHILENNSFSGASLSTDYRLRISYDQNGNIKTLDRNGYAASGNVAMDNLTYHYAAGTNRLTHVDDTPGNTNNYTVDIDDQDVNNYTYDAKGNMTRDLSEEIKTINWHINGKIEEVIRTSTSSKPDLEFHYDALGNRSMKIVKPRSSGVLSPVQDWTFYHYVRDASGGIMAIYEETFEPCGGNCSNQSASYISNLKLIEQPLYGSSLLGTLSTDIVQKSEVLFSGNDPLHLGLLDMAGSATYKERELGIKTYQLTDHLDNVHNTVADWKIWKSYTSESTIFNNTFEDPHELEDWKIDKSADVKWDEGNIIVTPFEPEVGLSRLIEEINPACTYRFCITIKELEAPVLVNLLDDKGKPIISEEIHEPGEYCWDIEELDGVSLFNIQIWGTEPEVPFVIEEISLTSTCPDNHLIADVLSALDYYPFGMIKPGRNQNATDYRYGFKSQEKDDEVKGSGNSYDFGARIYDPRLGRWLSSDPKEYAMPSHSPYSYALNSPMAIVDEAGEYPKPSKLLADYGFEVDPLIGGVIDGFISGLGWLDAAEFAYDLATDPQFRSDMIETLKVIASDPVAFAQHVAESYRDKLREIASGSDEGQYALGEMIGELAGGVVSGGAGFKLIKLGKSFKRSRMARRSNGPDCGCFTEGTLVLLDSGLVPIKDIGVGDMVYAYDLHNDTIGLKEVTHKHTLIREGYYLIYVGNEIVEATSDHPFFVNGSWIEVKDLVAGDPLQLLNSKTQTIDSIVYVADSVTVYNFTVKDFENYYVSSSSFLVHNCPWDPSNPVRKIRTGKWGNKNKYGGRRQTAIEHIQEGHYYNSRRGQRTSRFSQRNSTPARVKQLVNQAISNGQHSGARGNYTVTHTFNDVIGTTSDGSKTKKLKVYLDANGNVLNAYPVK